MTDDAPKKLTRAEMAERMGLSEEEFAAQLAATKPPGERILVTPEDPEVGRWQAYCEGCQRQIITSELDAVEIDAERHNAGKHGGTFEVRSLNR